MKGFKTVNTKKEFKDFVRTQNIVQAKTPHFIAQLGFEREEHLGEKNPYFEHASHQYFIAYDDKKPIGRISAQIDSLAQSEKGDKIGHFGLIEADQPQTLRALLSIAENWLIEHECEHIQGPLSLSINDESGVLVDGFDTPPYMMMNHAPPWYAEALEQTGYTKAKDLLAYHVKLGGEMPGAVSYMARQAEEAENITSRPIEMNNFDADLATILGIFNDAWANNWGFVPMTDAEMAYSAQNMKMLIKPDLARIAYVDGEPAAMIVALPNLNEALAGLKGSLLPFGWARLLWRLKLRGLRTGRVLLMGVRQEYQGSATASALSAMLIKDIRMSAKKSGMRALEMSWILEDNEPTKRLIEAVGGEAYKRYRIYEKPLIADRRVI